MTTASRTLASLAPLTLLLACTPESDQVTFGVSAMSFANAEWSAPVNLGPPINTSSIEFQPAISKNGLSLYFTSDRAGGVGGNDTWVSQRDCADRPWGTPVNLAVLNTTFSEGGAELSDDERFLFFFSGRPGGPGANDLYVSRRANPKDDFGWDAPTLLGTDVNTAAQENVGDYLRGNLYFNRNPIGGLGDIYYAPVTRDGETRGPAVLIAELSDPATNEFSPTVRTDGREIFFGSSRPGTFGLGDIWVSTRRSVHAAWSTPENLGRPVNSEFNDASVSLSPDGRTLLFDSDRSGGVGGRDIWMSTRGHHGNDDNDEDHACRGDDDRDD